VRLAAAALIALAIAGVGGVAAATAPGDGLPAYVKGYERWQRLNAKPIPVRGSDPHPSVKDVYASRKRTGKRFPVGTVVVKIGHQPGRKWTSLVATMRRISAARNGGWRWEEFTRSSPTERFAKVGFPESGCAACHAQAKARDSVFTRR
jgi:hypothetical protein